jgi:hypothetical protein|tara:strand:+ start:2242 stop:2400 length:159 start_codon:yes stop_codon:yes gene_type:complete
MVEKFMIEFLDKLKDLVIRTKEKLSEPVSAPRRKVILVGVGILIVIGIALVI